MRPPIPGTKLPKPNPGDRGTLRGYSKPPCKLTEEEWNNPDVVVEVVVGPKPEEEVSDE